jgi:hypothetical protein
VLPNNILPKKLVLKLSIHWAWYNCDNSIEREKAKVYTAILNKLALGWKALNRKKNIVDHSTSPPKSATKPGKYDGNFLVASPTGITNR